MIPELNQIILADCMDIMKDIPDKYFELAIVDPPYGIGFDKENESMSCGMRIDGTQKIDKSWSNPKPKNYKKSDWDKSIPDKTYFDELFRISQNQIIWGGNYFSEFLKPTGGWIVWDKKVPDKMSLSKCELAWESQYQSIKIFRYLWAGYKKQKPEQRFHSTQKPIDLYRWILQNYANPGDKIIDTHSGSGSLACACHLEKFDFLAIEKDADYYKSSVERLETLRSQGTLF
jgi:site-specific DNA-methyltransferase (adenine-specific)